MDNVNFVKLPSEILPTVTGNEVVIAETAAGKLYWCDSDGAKQLSDIDTAFPVGTIIERGDEVSPASYLLGTWEKIAQGRVVIGASAAYPLDSEGGSADAVAVEHFHKGLYYNAVSSPRLLSYGGGGTAPSDGGGSIYRDTEFQNPGSDFVTGNAGESGVGKNMQPYIAKNIWQRIA